MLASPVADADEVMRRVGDEAWIEDKYDGIRAQLHVEAGGTPRLFSRDLNDVTRSFPEIAEAASALRDAAPLVIDGELVPWREGSVLDFASLQTRLGRVRPSPELLAEVPVVLVAFDLLHHAGRDLLEEPLRERRAALEALALPDRTGERLLRSHLATARPSAEVDRHFDDARERRNEGLMVKDPDSTYQPGRRGLGWLKLKKALATLDCVVVGVEWGHGKRRGVLSDYTFAVRETDEPGARLLTIGKAYTGLTDAEIADDDRALQVDHAHRPRPLSDRRARGGRRDRLRPDHAIGAPSIGVRDAIPADRAHPRRQDAGRDRHARDGRGALRRAGIGPHPARHGGGRRDRAHRGHRLRR